MKRRSSIGAVAAGLLALIAGLVTNVASASANTGSVEFVCDNDGIGLSAVDVLKATGEHDVFLDYLSEYDPEGYEILTDPALSDKTIWAPTNEAFAELGDAPESATAEEVRAVLGFHITPPRRTPEGDYPIVTFEYLADGGQIIHQTRTGILTESDQRVRTKVEGGVYTVEGIPLSPTAWCTQAGSIFSIDQVITEVAVPGLFEQILGQAIYLVFFQYAYVSAIVALGSLALIGFLIIRAVRRRTPSISSVK